MNYRRLVLITLSSFLAFGLSVPAFAGQIEFFSVGAPNANAGKYAGSMGFGVSDNGVVAATANLGAAGEQAFAYTAGGGYYLLNASGRALAISGDGTRATGYVDGVGAMSWQTGTQNVVTLGGLSGYVQGSAISRNGAVVVGVGGSTRMASWNAADGSGGTAYDNLGGGFGWAGGISDNGIVGGTAATATARPAAIAQLGIAGSTQILGQGFLDGSIPTPYGKVQGINSDGTLMIGESDIGSGGNVYSASFIYDAALGNSLVKLNEPAGFSQTSANGLTERLFGGSALVVGNAWNESGGVITQAAATIWDPTSGAHLLANYAASNWGVSLPSGYSLLTAYGISTDGRFVTGSALDPSGNQVGFLISVPEPASIVSLALGSAIVLYGRRRNRS